MKKFIRKSLMFFAFPILIISILDIMLSQLLEENSLSIPIESKIYKLGIDNSSLNVIVAGDSRGERQLIPRIIKASTGYNSINISVSSGDLISTSYALDKIKSKKVVFVISASSWQINDGANDPGYLSLKCFQKLTITEKCKIYGSQIGEFLRLEKSLLTSQIKKTIKGLLGKEVYYYDEEILKELGFLGIRDTIEIDTENIKSIIDSHSWYKNYKNNGGRWRIFKEAINKLGTMNALIIIYQPPVSPIWKEKTKETLIGYAESQYSEKLKTLCSQFENIVFYDFYNNDIKYLDNNFYYDYQHLNRKGAEYFSLFLSEIILEEINSFNVKKSKVGTDKI